MEEGDLRTVLSWRNSDRIRRVSLTDHEISWEEHLAWYEGSKTDESRELMVFELSHQLTGVVIFSSIDRRAGSSEWGFYLGRSDVPRGSASIMGFLAMEHAFGALALECVIGEAFVSNESSLRYHRRLGFEENDGGHRIEKAGKMHELARFEITADRWRNWRGALESTLFPEVEK